MGGQISSGDYFAAAVRLVTMADDLDVSVRGPLRRLACAYLGRAFALKAGQEIATRGESGGADRALVVR